MFICYDTIYNIFCYFDIRVGVKMGETIKKELILNGLHCANCANKIEKEVVDKRQLLKWQLVYYYLHWHLFLNSTIG